MFKFVETVLFVVEDIHLAAQWYAGLLESEVEYENPNYAFVRGAGVNFGFHPADAKNSAGANGCVVYFEVSNVEDAITRLTSMGASLYRGPMKTTLGADAAMLKDPFGNEIGVNAAGKS